MKPGGANDVMHWKRGLRFEKKQWVEFLPWKKKVDFQSWAKPDDFVRYGCNALVGLRADDVKAASIERLCLSLSTCRITFYSKSRTWTNFVKFRVFGFPVSILHIRISGYVTWLRLSKIRKKRKKRQEINMIDWFKRVRVILYQEIRKTLLLYIHIYILCFNFIWFYGISTIVGYLIPNPLYTCLYIYIYIYIYIYM